MIMSFQAIDDEDIALVVHAADVARVEPPVADGFRRRVRPVVIAFHYVVSPNHDLAELAVRHLRAGGIDDPHVRAPHRLADASGDAVVLDEAERGDRLVSDSP
jgi:hypothetical protein